MRTRTEAPGAGRSRFDARVAELFGIDGRSLAAFRIGLGLVLLTDLACRLPDLTAHYTDDGALPRATLPGVSLSLHLLGGSALFEGALFALAGLFALALLAGLHTRLAAFASWLLLYSLFFRNLLVQDSSDILLRLLLFWGMFLPLGARWSLDARRALQGKSGPVFSVASVALLLQVAFVYWFAVALKSNDPAWWTEGRAVGYALRNPYYATGLGERLLAHPDWISALTFATLLLEAVGPLLAFCPVFTGPVRTAVVLAFILFHTGLGLCLHLGIFPLACVVAWLAFLPGWFWDRLPRRVWGGRQAAERGTPLPAEEGVLRAGPAPRGGLSALLANLVAACCLVLVFLTNVRTLDEHEFGHLLPPVARLVGRLVGLDQNWCMFSAGQAQHGWYVVAADLADGSRVDLLTGNLVTFGWQPPEESLAARGQRWSNYDQAALGMYGGKYRPDLLRYLCREWNARHGAQGRVTALTVYYFQRRVLPNYRLSGPQTWVLARQRCDGPEGLP
jgi:hypothetical protein